jgi:predicted nucleotidyltransferase
LDPILEGLVTKLRSSAGPNLRSVVLYGSAASGEFHARHSDLNVLCLVHRMDPAELRKLQKPAAWLARKRHPMPLVLTLDELREAADMYAIELLEIKAHRQVLYGEDVFDSIDVPMSLHRFQVERELRHSLIRLREGYLGLAGNRKAVMALMLRSAPGFALLFRHALIALGEDAPGSRREAVHRLARLIEFDASSFDALFAVRDGRQNEKDLNSDAVFEKYLNAITRAVGAVDRRFEQLE